MCVCVGGSPKLPWGPHGGYIAECMHKRHPQEAISPDRSTAYRQFGGHHCAEAGSPAWRTALQLSVRRPDRREQAPTYLPARPPRLSPSSPPALAPQAQALTPPPGDHTPSGVTPPRTHARTPGAEPPELTPEPGPAS